MTHLIRILPGILLLAACGGSSGSTLPPDPPLPPGITILNGAGVADTIDAILPQLLEVVVRDEDGKPLPGEMVRFDGTEGVERRQTVLIGINGPGFNPWWDFETDRAGRVAVRLQLGRVPGTGSVTIAILGPRGYRATAPYTILTGAPARVEAAPRDTSVFSGQSFGIRTAPTDRARNPVGGSPTFTVVDGPATVDAAGVVSTTSTLGTARIAVRLGSAVDTVRVGIVPHGALAASSMSDGGGRHALQSEKARLIRVADGLVIGVSYPGEVVSAVWRPGGPLP